MNTQDLIAIDIHTHAEVSCWNPFDNYGEEYDRAADKYFGSDRRPTIAETVAYYREQQDRPGDVHRGFRVATGPPPHPERGDRRGRPEANSDMMIAFASHRPAQGQDGRARGAPADRGARHQGLQVPPHGAGLPARTDRMAWPLYEVIAEHKLPAIFHSGHSGIGSGMRCGGGLRLANCPTRCCWKTWRSTSRTCRSSSPTPAGPGRTRR